MKFQSPHKHFALYADPLVRWVHGGHFASIDISSHDGNLNVLLNNLAPSHFLKAESKLLKGEDRDFFAIIDSVFGNTELAEPQKWWRYSSCHIPNPCLNVKFEGDTFVISKFFNSDSSHISINLNPVDKVHTSDNASIRAAQKLFDYVVSCEPEYMKRREMGTAFGAALSKLLSKLRGKDSRPLSPVDSLQAIAPESDLAVKQQSGRFV